VGSLATASEWYHRARWLRALWETESLLRALGTRQKATKPSTKGFAMSRSRQKSTSKKPLCWGSFVRHSTNVYRVRFGPRQNCHVCCVPHLTLNKIAIRKKLKITRKKWGGPHRPAIRLFSREMNSMSHATWPARPVTHEQYAGQQYRGSGLVVTK
jgi:hypothetical protein